MNNQQPNQDKSNQQHDTPTENRELYRLHATWYANLPPPADELVIQEKEVHLLHKDLIERKVESIPVKDIAHVNLTSIPMFAALEIIGTDSSRVLKITGVDKEEAVHAKNLLEGMILHKAGEVKVPDNLNPDEKQEHLAQKASVPYDDLPSGSS